MVNRKTWRILAGAVAITALTACGSPQSKTDAEPQADVRETPALSAVVAGDHRSEGERARDQYRNPVDTLEFFGLEPDMTVVEIAPGGGWYTQIIAPYLKEGGGVLYAAHYNRDGASERALQVLADFETHYVKAPEKYGKVVLTELNAPMGAAPAGTADMVLTFRNVHNWQKGGNAAERFASFYAALKPGGVLGIVEHRADGADLPRDGSSGYAYTDDVVALAKAAGFDFDQASEINANPADTKNHPFGVWTLAPSRRSSSIRGVVDPEFDRATYDAIGESDRMTLKFRKPIAADGALLE